VEGIAEVQQRIQATHRPLHKVIEEETSLQFQEDSQYTPDKQRLSNLQSLTPENKA